MASQVLHWVRGSAAFKRLLVVVLSRSDWPEDVRRAYAFGANAYVVKPQDPTELVRLVARLQQYWLRISAAVTADPAGNCLLAL